MIPVMCRMPPLGWWCSREAHHDGPCACLPWYRGIRERMALKRSRKRTQRFYGPTLKDQQKDIGR